MGPCIVYIVLYLYLMQCYSARTILDSYNEQRNYILQIEDALSVGGNITLSEEEKEANNVLMRWKETEMDFYFRNPEYFNLSRHYFTYKKYIELSKVYQIIRRMPKGGALHIHGTLMLDADSLVELTYEDHLYACYGDNLKFKFSATVPRPDDPLQTTPNCSTEWTLLKDLRNASGDVKAFDYNLKQHFTIYTENEKDQEIDINKVWIKFEAVVQSISTLISYRPVREKFFYKSLKKFYDDNVMYIEIRSGLHKLYELNNTVHDKMFMPKLIKKVTDNFIQDYPDFIGVKFIVTKGRNAGISVIRDTLNLARKFKREMPEIFAGFDLVGQEDIGRPLKDYLPLLIEVKNEIDFYFHGGETNWFGTPTDENLIDAILLGTKRIGHGYALMKHPNLLVNIRQKDIAVEVNVISNEVLSLVKDVRNHPLATYLSLGLPVVLSSDDPGTWGADPLSHDFYVSFIGVASKHADLRMLKQLALNSIKYSALNYDSKLKFYNVFTKRWSKFIKELNTF